MSVYQKLINTQEELKAPKNAYNSFGKYHYRSCEDILEGLKPVLKKNGATVVITDSIELVGDRYYVKATAKFVDIESGESVENSAYARESLDKKGMDDSQITGATSSYARKYALNGLFLIDDTKDADTDEYQNQQKSQKSQSQQNSQPKQNSQAQQTTQPVNEAELNQQMVDSVDPDLVPSGQGMTEKRLKRIKKAMEFTGKNLKTVLATARADSLETITEANYIAVMSLFLKLMSPEQKKEIESI